MSHLPDDDERLRNVAELIPRLEEFTSYLTDRNHLIVHQQVDQFFYMQTTAELKLLLNEYHLVNERLHKIAGWLDEKYRVANERLKIDTCCLSKIEGDERLANRPNDDRCTEA